MCHDRLEGLPPRLAPWNFPWGLPTPQGTTNLNSRETLSRVFLFVVRLTPPTATLISRVTCRPRSACATAQALSALPVTWAVLSPSAESGREKIGDWPTGLVSNPGCPVSFESDGVSPAIPGEVLVWCDCRDSHTGVFHQGYLVWGFELKTTCGGVWTQDLECPNLSSNPLYHTPPNFKHVLIRDIFQMSLLDR